MTENPAAFRAGTIAIVGKPNVGKSTLLNRIVGQKLSITSSKPQTTRLPVTGILTRDDAQFVFVDTPGFQTRHSSGLNRLMNRSVARSLEDVDVVLMVVQAGRLDQADRQVVPMLPRNRPVLLALNKVDKIGDKTTLLPYLAQVSEDFPFAEMVPVSAEKGTQVLHLLDVLRNYLPEQDALFAEDEITQGSERFFAAEFLREKLFRNLGEELPYATAVVIDSFLTEGGLRRIHATVLVDKASQKAILIGEGGQRMKRVATQARLDLEKLFGGKVFLEVWVKVREGWADSDQMLRNLGYDA